MNHNDEMGYDWRMIFDDIQYAYVRDYELY